MARPFRTRRRRLSSAVQDDPLAGGSPSLPFPTVGTKYTGIVTEATKLVQGRDYESGDPATWPDGNPKMVAVIELIVDGEERSLWAKKPGDLFTRLQEAQKKAGSRILPGGKLEVEFIGEEANKNPRLKPTKLHRVTYTPAVAGGKPDPLADVLTAEQKTALYGVA